MANFFDQFDEQPAAAKPNFFDQFDAPAAQPAPSAPAATSPILDTVESLGSGVVRGGVELGMLPITAARGLGHAMNWTGDKIEGAGRYLTGAEPVSEQEMAQREAKRASMEAWNPLYRFQDDVRRGMNEQLHAPETTAGKYAQTMGEFFAPGGMPSRVVREAPTIGRALAEYGPDIWRNVVVPALFSEGAGQLTEGTQYETPARVAGAVLGGGITTGLRAYNAPDMVVRRATGDVTEAQWQEAKRLLDNTTGVRVTGPEALTQATGGGTALTNLQRVVEGSTEGRAATAPFFAQRPAQVDRAVNTTLDKISPQDAAPTSLGARSAQAATAAITKTPEGQALSEAVVGAGPRTTPLQAGEAIQQPVADIYARREGMRNALADADYTAAREAPARVPVDTLAPQATTVNPAYTSIRPTTNAVGENPRMVPAQVAAEIETPALTSRTGPEAIQADPRGVLQFIDDLIPTARAGTQESLRTVRQALYDRGGIDTSVNGLDSVRGAIGDMITEATRTGNRQTAELLTRVQERLDQSLRSVPEYNQARTGFEAASVPLRPFENPAMAKVVERDQFGRDFTTPPEKVPTTLDAGGPTAARAFNEVAPTEARVAYENHIGTRILDQASDAAGNVSADRLAQAIRANEDVLAQYPALAERLNEIVTADAGMTGVRSGTLGRVSRASDTTTAANEILPRTPHYGSAGELQDAVARLIAEDAPTTSALMRQNLADRYGKASQGTAEGNREFAGGKFFKEIAGDPNKQEVLDAVLSAFPGAPNLSMDELLAVLETVGRRKQIGSATSFNDSIKSEIGTLSPFATAVDIGKTAGISFLTKATDATKRAALRGNLRKLADMFTADNSIEQIRAAGQRGLQPSVLPTAVRTGAQVAPILSQERSR